MFVGGGSTHCPAIQTYRAPSLCQSCADAVIGTATAALTTIDLRGLLAFSLRARSAMARERVRAYAAVRSAELLPLALCATGRALPSATEARRYDGAITAEETTDATVWNLAVSRLELNALAEVDVLRGPRAVIDALTERH